MMSCLSLDLDPRTEMYPDSNERLVEEHAFANVGRWW